MNTTQRIILYAVPWEAIAFVVLVAAVLLFEKLKSKRRQKKQPQSHAGFN